MQSSDQPPEEKQPPIDQPAAPNDYTPASNAAALSSEAQSEQELLNRGAHEDIPPFAGQDDAVRKEQANPSPSSFYERELDRSAGTPPTPIAYPTHEPSDRPHEQFGGQAQPWNAAPYPPSMVNPSGFSQQPPPGYPAYPQGQQYPGVLPPPYVAGPPPARQSRKWIWILISVLVVILLGSCGLCTWAVNSSFIGKTFSQTFNATISSNRLVNDYYSAIQNKQYTQAYNYLSPEGSLQGMSSDQFVAQATRRDDLYGPVLRYTPSQPQLSPSYDGGNLNSLSINVSIARQKKSYTAHLELKLINNQWRIVSYDQL